MFNKRLFLVAALSLLGAQSAFAFGVSPAQVELLQLKESSTVRQVLHLSDAAQVVESVNIDVRGDGAAAISIPEEVLLDYENGSMKLEYFIEPKGFSPGEYSAQLLFSAPLYVNYAPSLDVDVLFTVTEEDHRNYTINHFDFDQFEAKDKFTFRYQDHNLGNIEDKADKVVINFQFEDGSTGEWESSDLPLTAAFTEAQHKVQSTQRLPIGGHKLSAQFYHKDELIFEVNERKFYVTAPQGIPTHFWLLLAILTVSSSLALYFRKKTS